ncbi:calcium-translocating P-type ATPase, PMCA-type [Prevotella sp. BV3P1]|uniref:calcium-translocating P-type ATPase, PMCA-type n=1 Tax=Prevotellaceae TaxID=171552 RepID=UPI0003B81EB4|nr:MULTISPECIES: calcium-translocating P-type ATPase, PMCA-type [Prevotellaceae]ERT56983.1 calcium-translocating P-type ATPase, PMCA-type [Prevotella sp. BV3P1]KGF41567.1 haloacid dehalogenase [Hoylesella buccalis DNF00985]
MSTQDIKNVRNHHTGLTDEQVAANRIKFGKNILTPPPTASLWKLYLDKYRDPIIQVLLVAAAVSLVLAFVEQNFTETIGIFVAIFFATSIGFYFERDAAKKFNILNALNEESLVKVRRNGHVVEIPRKDVVVGDLMIIEVGDEIPADGKLVKGVDLLIDESSLTGEPICSKGIDVDDDEEDEAHEKTYPHDAVLRSTMVMNGSGAAVVTAVGDATEIGKVARNSSEITHTQTPLDTQLAKLAKLISVVGSAVAVAAFIIFLIHDILVNDAVWHGTDYFKMAEVVLQYFMMAVTLIVMAVPEGLPMAVTLSLALNMRRMLKSNNLVRKLHACETMGAVTVICTDKTGTLTENKMTVMEMTGSLVVTEVSEHDALAQAIALNTTAELGEDGAGIGNPTEIALLTWLQKHGVDYQTIRNQATTIAQLPFSTENKYMATVAEMGGRKYLFVKGAPEIVMNFCTLSEAEKQSYQSTLLGYQLKAMRTLAFACKQLEADALSNIQIRNHLQNLSLQCVAAISDPVRVDVPNAVNQCQQAGIEVKVVTGDTQATAIEIARQIGVWNDDTPKEAALTGPEWNALSDEEAYERAHTIKVMSRARPSDKQRLVEMLQKRKEVVAVTGDGTNDAPALHYAHVGLSLGSGTSVAKEASDMTLLDDSFGSIAHAVMWGRSLYKNIQRFLFFQLIVNITALLLVLGGAFIGVEMPLTVTQILWVNLLMDTFAAMALATLPPSREVMKDKPRKENEFILNKEMRQDILFCGVTFFILLSAMLVYCERDGSQGISMRELTIFFTTFVMIQLWNLFNAKTLGSNHSAFRYLWKDKGLLLVLLLVILGQWLIVTFGGKMFRTVPLSLSDWLGIIGFTSVVLWVGELWRWTKRLRVRKS